MKPILLPLLFLYLTVSQPISVVREPKARIVPELDIIYVEWQSGSQSQNTMYTVRHKSESEQAAWKYVKTGESSVRIPLGIYNDGDSVHIQIKTERGAQIVEDWTTEIVVDVAKKSVRSAPKRLAPPPSQPIVQAPAPAHHANHHVHPHPHQQQTPVQPQTHGQHSQGHHQVPAQSPIAPAGPIVNTPGSLVPPLHFTANIMNPTTVQLKWQPAMPGKQHIYYLVNVKQLTTSSGSTLQNQQIKTAATSFTLGKMIAGEKYEMTIRSATSQDTISSTASIVEITMPREDDYFEIGNLIISSHFRTATQGIVNLTWEVPPTMQNKIVAYNVEYSEMGNSRYWQKIQFHGASSSAALHHLKSNTEYLLRIKTTLANNIVTESGQFRFRTPRVETNPINKVDVIYSHDVNSVKLQWMLEPHIRQENVAGYDVYLSQDKDLPDSQWKLVRLNNRESHLSLEDLKSSTIYFVRVNVRNTDGSVIRAPSVYRFKTIDNTDEEEFEGNSLAYRNVAPGEVEIRWTFPKSILDSVIGATILYTNRKDLTPEQWQKIEIEDSKNTTVLLKHLTEGVRYSVQIIPRLYTGDYDFESRELFEFKTDKMTRGVTQGSDVRTLTGHPLAGPHFEQMSHSEAEFMRIVSCNPDEIKSGCAWDEICINRVEDRNKGWCISNTLRDSILNS
ncbi:Fibronectin type-III domain-containing protein [Caenorhabditis elegans]|uniref:Fibronectin type-III domain-containing protein n=1 Tax=Caenorhabditis elegans TaxID=6239 RepID=Q23266_CAEEL|nr:Fibronectin type-III domain-containing protein [Caenorhabditis elegans]CAA96700.3 Fibronectin type-III domain-containing protein [Caenorhabditis elegans]